MILTVTMNAAIDKRYVVDGAKTGEVNRVITCTATPGGKGLNVSKPAAIAGAEVAATGLAGGHAGGYIMEGLKTLGIRNEFYRLEKESRTCINIWDKETCKQTEFLEPGFKVEKEEYAGFLEKYQSLAAEADVIVLSGSVPYGLDENTYPELIKIAKEAGKKVILDTSGDLLRKGIGAKPDMIKPNIDEIRALTGRECITIDELLEAAVEIHRSGIETVVISLGADGALAVCSDGVYRASVPRIEAVNTVGCGDCMIAGFAIGFEKWVKTGQRNMEEILREASAISAAAATREETGYFLYKDKERLKNKIIISVEKGQSFRDLVPNTTAYSSLG
ncbi:MAG: 1-phosphofructokinase family hexose kinase [Muricomes sp.]|nr:1-phosphofructokinase family hexose kinase [Muricomes sp.]